MGHETTGEPWDRRAPGEVMSIFPAVYQRREDLRIAVVHPYIFWSDSDESRTHDSWVFGEMYVSYMREGWQLTFHRRVPGGMFSGWYLISPDSRWARVWGGGGVSPYPREWHKWPLRVADWIVTHGWPDDWDVYTDHGLMSVSPRVAW